MLCAVKKVIMKKQKKKRKNSSDLQEPINDKNESDVIGGQSNGGKHNYHGDETCLWHSGRTDGGCSCCDTGIKTE